MIVRSPEISPELATFVVTLRADPSWSEGASVGFEMGHEVTRDTGPSQRAGPRTFASILP